MQMIKKVLTICFLFIMFARINNSAFIISKIALPSMFNNSWDFLQQEVAQVKGTGVKGLIKFFQNSEKLFENKAPYTIMNPSTSSRLLIPIENKKCEYTVVSDIHGNLDVLKGILEENNFFAKMASKDEPVQRFVFLGDNIDRGENSLEVIITVLKLKEKYPNNIFIIRGNHEDNLSIGESPSNKGKNLSAELFVFAKSKIDDQILLKQSATTLFKKFPILMEVKLKNNYKMLFLHGTLPIRYNRQIVVVTSEIMNFEEQVLWNRLDTVESYDDEIDGALHLNIKDIQKAAKEGSYALIIGGHVHKNIFYQGEADIVTTGCFGEYGWAANYCNLGVDEQGQLIGIKRYFNEMEDIVTLKRSLMLGEKEYIIFVDQKTDIAKLVNSLNFSDINKYKSRLIFKGRMTESQLKIIEWIREHNNLEIKVVLDNFMELLDLNKELFATSLLKKLIDDYVIVMAVKSLDGDWIYYDKNFSKENLQKKFREFGIIDENKMLDILSKILKMSFDSEMDMNYYTQEFDVSWEVIIKLIFTCQSIYAKSFTDFIIEEDVPFWIMNCVTVGGVSIKQSSNSFLKFKLDKSSNIFDILKAVLGFMYNNFEVEDRIYEEIKKVESLISFFDKKIIFITVVKIVKLVKKERFDILPSKIQLLLYAA